MRSLILRFLLSVFLFPGIIHAMVFDNRYFPLIQEPYITVEDRPSHLRVDLFATTGNSANGRRENHEGIPEIFGLFDLATLGRAMQQAGYAVPLTPVQLSSKLPFTLQGKIQTQGVSASFHWQPFKRIGFGMYLMGMQSNSSLNFFFDQKDATGMLSPSEIVNLNVLRRQMLQELGLSCNYVHQTGFGDIDAYIRIGDRWEYELKMRSIQAGARFGMLAPTGQRKKINEPASVPFGGDGFWGVYVSTDAEFEFREDWKCGLILRASKRIPEVRCERMPTDGEQPLFGTVVGAARVSPGWTGVFLPYLELENLRGGLGIRAQYTLIAHQKDSWQDRRLVKTVPVNAAALEDTSGWASEDITLTGFYDFGKTKMERGRDPIILLSWYIPVALLVANQSVRSYKVSLGVEFNF